MEKKREASEEGLDEDETKELEKYEAKALSTDYTGVFQGTLRFYAIEESINVAAILFLIMLIVCIIGFIATIALNIKTWLAAAKEMPVKPVAIQAPAGFNVIAQNSVQAEDDEDEEEYV